MNHDHEGRTVLLTTLTLIMLTGCQRSQIDVQDDFESPALSAIWSTDRMELRSFSVQSQTVRSGKSAAMITLRTGDVVEEATDKDKSSERDELLENWRLYALEDVKYEYRFSMFLPDSFPIVPTRLVIAQWKQLGFYSNESPVLALRYQSGRMFLTLQTETGRRTLWEVNGESRNRWLDFCFQVRFSKHSNGEVKGFLNGEQIVDFEGITSYSRTLFHLGIKSRYYFKMGLYRDRMPEPMSICIDRYSKKEIPG